MVGIVDKCEHGGSWSLVHVCSNSGGGSNRWQQPVVAKTTALLLVGALYTKFFSEFLLVCCWLLALSLSFWFLAYLDSCRLITPILGNYYRKFSHCEKNLSGNAPSSNSQHPRKCSWWKEPNISSFQTHTLSSRSSSRSKNTQHATSNNTQKRTRVHSHFPLGLRYT